MTFEEGEALIEELYMQKIWLCLEEEERAARNLLNEHYMRPKEARSTEWLRMRFGRQIAVRKNWLLQHGYDEATRTLWWEAMRDVIWRHCGKRVYSERLLAEVYKALS